MTASEILQAYTGLKKMKRYIIIDITMMKLTVQLDIGRLSVVVQCGLKRLKVLLRYTNDE